MENYYKTKSIFKLIKKWKWHLLIIVVLAGGLSVFFSSPKFIKPKYKSTATLYPANTASISTESETEQMLEIIKSNDIKFQIIESFNLFEHYGIDRADPNAKDIILRYYNGNISFQKTPNEAVIISVMDIDPQLASDIADSIICFYNQKMLNLNRLKSKELAKVYKSEIEKRNIEIDSIANILKSYQTNYGILDLSTQVEKYTEAIYMGKSLTEAREIIGNWEKYGADYHKTDSLYYSTISSMLENKAIYDEFIRDSEKILTYSHVISKPFPADKKSYPVRSIIVLFSILGAFFMGLIVIALIEGRKK